MKMTVLICLLLLSTSVSAADNNTLSHDEQQQIAENINQIGQEISKNIHKTSQQLQVIIPALTNNLNSIISSFTTEMIPIVQALKENTKLTKATDEMAEALKDSFPAQYKQELKYQIDSKNNQLTIDGTITENEDKIHFNIIRNIAATTITQNLIDIPAANSQTKKIYDLNKRKLPLNAFKQEKINNNIFLVYENQQQQETFILGNLNPVLNLQIQSQGPNHSEKIRDFIKSLDLSKMNQAINYNSDNTYQK